MPQATRPYVHHSDLRQRALLTYRSQARLLLLPIVMGLISLLLVACAEVSEDFPLLRESVDDDFRYTCGSEIGFKKSIRSLPRPAKPLRNRLSRLVARGEGVIPKNGWRVARDAQRVMAIARTPQHELPFARALFRRQEGGGDGWRIDSYGACRPYAFTKDRVAAQWMFNSESHPPDQSERELPIWINSFQCAGSEDFTATVVYEERQIAVVVLEETTGAMGTCEGEAPQRYVIELDEPVGDRTIVDAGFLPIGQPRVYGSSREQG